MCKKIIKLSLLLCCFGTSIFGQRLDPEKDPDQWKNSIFLGISGGIDPSFGELTKMQRLGYFGQADIDFFVRHNLSLGADYAFHYFPGKNDYVSTYIHEVLINTSFYFKSSWHPHITFGIGYYGTPDIGLFGCAPGVGVMKKLSDRIYITAKGSVDFVFKYGTYAKIGVGFSFQAFKHKPLPPSYLR